MFRVSLIAALFLALAGSAAAAGNVSSARPTIARANADWFPAMQAGDAERVAEPYATDGVFVLPNGQTIVGRAAVADFYRKQLSGGRKILKGGVQTDGLGAAAGGLVIEWGHGGVTSVDAAGKTTTSSGPYITLWKKGADGRWAIVRNLIF
ncbi:MAG: YybH family protein [Phenylobacterium sp.]